MVDEVSPFVQMPLSVLPARRAYVPLEMLYLLLDDYVAEDTHSGNSSVGTGAPQGISAQFSLQLMLGSKETFQMNSQTFKITWF